MNKKIDFEEFVVEEVIDLSRAILELMNKYYQENLRGFNNEQQIRIGTAAVIKLFSEVHITNIILGISNIEKYMKIQNLITEYIKKRIKDE